MSKHFYTRESLVDIREKADSSQEAVSWRRGPGKEAPRCIVVTRDEMGGSKTSTDQLSDWERSRTSASGIDLPDSKQQSMTSLAGGEENDSPSSASPAWSPNKKKDEWVYRTANSCGVVSEAVQWSEIITLIDEGLVEKEELEVRRTNSSDFLSFDEATKSMSNSTSTTPKAPPAPPSAAGAALPWVADSVPNQTPPLPRSQQQPPQEQQPPQQKKKAKTTTPTIRPPQPVASLDDMDMEPSGATRILSPGPIGSGPGAVLPPEPLGFGGPIPAGGGSNNNNYAKRSPMHQQQHQHQHQNHNSNNNKMGGAGQKAPHSPPVGGKVVWGGAKNNNQQQTSAPAVQRRAVPKVVPVTTRNDLDDSEFPSLDSLGGK